MERAIDEIEEENRKLNTLLNRKIKTIQEFGKELKELKYVKSCMEVVLESERQDVEKLKADLKDAQESSNEKSLEIIDLKKELHHLKCLCDNVEELELLRQYFYNDKDDCKGKNNSLTNKILKIQKQSKLKDNVNYFTGTLVTHELKIFNEILKELGYEG